MKAQDNYNKRLKARKSKAKKFVFSLGVKQRKGDGIVFEYPGSTHGVNKPLIHSIHPECGLHLGRE